MRRQTPPLIIWSEKYQQGFFFVVLFPLKKKGKKAALKMVKPLSPCLQVCKN